MAPAASPEAESRAFWGGLTLRRRIAGFAVALLAGPPLVLLFTGFHSPELIAAEVLAFQLLVVVVALVGGIWPALFTAVLSALTLDIFFIEPHLTIAVADPVHLLTLLLHIAIAVLVSYVVGRAERQRQHARQAEDDAELLQEIAGSVLRGNDVLQSLLDRSCEAFAFAHLSLVSGGKVVVSSGDPAAEGPPSSYPVDADSRLEIRGPEPSASERRLLSVVSTQIAAVLEHRKLEEVASEIEPIAASDRVRGALLSALSHDLRRPLAAATTAVGGLRTAGDGLSAEDRRELLETADESLVALTDLVTDLLDVSRVQAGALSISPVPLDPVDAILPAVEEFETADPRSAPVELRFGHGAAQALADPILLQRALANLIANALRFSPSDTTVLVSTSTAGERLEIRIVDRGPGVPAARRNEIFVPFQRLGDTDNTTGLGLGLALSRGFVEAMRGTLEPDITPGGGLTMVVSLPRAALEEHGGTP